MSFIARLASLAVLAVSVLAAPATSNPWDEPQDTAAAITDPDRYAWRLFVALNWPADAVNRKADPNKPFGENHLTVWESWKLSSGMNDEVFLAGGKNPGPWLPGSTTKPSNLSDLEAMPLQQAARVKAGPAQPAFDPATSRFGRNENHMNQAAYEFIRTNELYNVEGQEKLFEQSAQKIRDAEAAGRTIDPREYRLDFPLAAKEVKAQWRRITEADKPRYRWHEFTDDAGNKELFGLTALHITTKDLPNWVWATFEHVDNPKREGAEPWLLPSRDRSAGANGIPANMGIEGTRWENYRLRGTQFEFADSTGTPTILANSQIEEGFQSTSSCITCHARASIGAHTDRVAQRLSIFEVDDEKVTIGSVGTPQQSLFVVRTIDAQRNGKLRYQQLDFVWSLFRAKRKAMP